MGSRLLLNLLARRHARREQGAISAAAGIVAALVLILSGAAVVQLSGGNLRGVFASSDTRAARAAAAEGTDLMIDTWNQPQNRRLLVSGQDPAAWDRTTLRSPCFNTEDGSRPGPDEGRPDQAAINLGDGQWRDVVTGATGGAAANRREFRLVRVSYTASDGRTNPDPRALRRTATPGGGITGSALPTGFTSWDQLVNLNDPDGIGNLQPGRNSGFLVLEVEGRVVRGGQVVANSRETREFEVLPKCCGASMGSNNSGGTNYAGTTGSLGSDSRLCNLQYGIVTGFNGGWHWSYFANDQFTQRNPTSGTIERYGPILGVVPNAGDLFERRTCRVRPGPAKLSPIAPGTDPCPETFPPGDPRGTDNPGRNRDIRNAGTPTAAEQICRQPQNDFRYFSGPDSDIRGTSASCSPIVALEATAFPDIDDFVYNWTANWGPDQIIVAADAENNKLANVAFWPLLSTDNGDGSSGPNSGATIRLRTNNISDEVEVCLVDLNPNGITTDDDCVDETWLSVTADGAPDLTTSYETDFSDSGGNPDADDNDGTASFAGPWIENGGATIISGGNDFYRLPAGATAQRQADTSMLKVPYLTFRVNRNGWSSATLDYLDVEASFDGGTNWRLVRRIYRNSIPSSGVGRVNLALPFTSTQFVIRFRTDNLEGSEVLNFDDVLIQSGRPTLTPGTVVDTAFRAAWCEYASSSPITLAPGFHCIGPTINQFDGGRVFIDTSGGPLSLLYNEPPTTDLRFGVNTTANPENFIYLSRSPAQLTHVACNTIENECDDVIDDENYNFSPVGEPDRLNFFGRDTGVDGQEQNVLITTPFEESAKIGGVWFYLPQGWVELTIIDDGASAIPDGFYDDNEDNWSFFGRIWVKNFKPYGAFHLRVPDSRLTTGALGEANPAQFVPWNGIDWVARATTNTRLW